jgi:tRNA-2-methylthio-N6-dimethylallyladenosine synthase
MSVKKERLSLLQKQILEQAATISQGMMGSVQRVLVQGVSKKSDSEMSGRTENNRVVNFAGPARLIGQMIDVRITSAQPNSLRGVAEGVDIPRSIPIRCVTT